MEALASSLVGCMYLHGDQDGGDRSQETIYPALFARVCRPDEEYPDGVVT